MQRICDTLFDGAVTSGITLQRLVTALPYYGMIDRDSRKSRQKNGKKAHRKLV